tara:strand:+ start:142 stop:390 length:249 start_codon:yes stop_codon:yes gene_type:complete
MKTLKTRQPLNVGKKYKLFTDFGIYYVFLSHTVNQDFSIGDITFNAIGGYPSNGFRPDKPIPESWIIDLSKPLNEGNHANHT